MPQGAVLSTTLYKFFTDDCPATANTNAAYADDVTVSESLPDKTPDASQLADLLNGSFPPIVEWAERNHLQISSAKSSVTLFTPWTKQFQAHPQVNLHNTTLPLVKTPKILGVTLDPSLTFTPHVKDIALRCLSRLSILKALTSTSWGHQKETLKLTYNSLIKPLFTYAAPIWYPSTSRTNIQTLQTVQNKALRIISGSLQMADQHHLHAETITLPVKHELDMLCKQFLVSALRPTHPSHQHVTADPGPRADCRMPTLRSKFLPEVQQYLTDDTTPVDLYEKIRDTIHTSALEPTP